MGYALACRHCNLLKGSHQAGEEEDHRALVKDNDAEARRRLLVAYRAYLTGQRRRHAEKFETFRQNVVEALETRT